MKICLFSFLFVFLSASAAALEMDDATFLNLIEKRTFNYFLECTNFENGLVMDRADNVHRSDFSYAPATVAGTGFGLSAIIAGVERGYITREKALDLTLKTLRYFKNSVKSEHGFYFHFMDMKTGNRVWNCELSSIDTTLFLAGVITAREYYQHPEVSSLADHLFLSADWNWMTNGRNLLCMGWKPEEGFISSYWDSYCELLMMYLLALGSPSHPVKPELWDNFLRTVDSYKGKEMIACPPLFTHQYSHIWVDFRNCHDNYADYFENSVRATLANRQYCIDLSGYYKTFSPDCWGLTACISPSGYCAMGAAPGIQICDGTVAPTAAGSSIVFTPEESIRVLRYLYDSHPKMWGRYGFSDSLNTDHNYYAFDAYAINQGPLLLMIENYRSELIWKTFMKNPWIRKGMEIAGFKPGKPGFLSNDLPRSNLHVYHPDKKPEITAVYAPEFSLKNGFEDPAWNKVSKDLTLDSSFLENGILEQTGYRGSLKVLFTDSELFFRVSVKDSDLLLNHSGKEITRNDGVEFFIDSDCNGLKWKQKGEYQIIASPSADFTSLQVSEFFHDKRLDSSSVVRKNSEGYEFILGVSRKQLDLNSSKTGFSIVFHNIDKSSEAWLNWFFHRPQNMLGIMNLSRENRQ